MSLNPRIKAWAGRTVWLVGASSGIGRATAARLHALGARVVVSARSVPALRQFEQEHPGSQALPLDATDHVAMRAAVAQIVARHGRIDLVLFSAGTYASMRATSFDLDVALRHQQVNVAGALVLLGAVLPQLLAQAAAGQGGHLSIVSSVAGYRGLPRSLAYGPTKAALINLAENLYLDLHPLGLGVSLINPGFVDTPLTHNNGFHMPAMVSPAFAAQAMVDGWAAGRFEIHFPRRFTWWLKALRLLPDVMYFSAVRRFTGG